MWATIIYTHIEVISITINIDYFFQIPPTPRDSKCACVAGSGGSVVYGRTMIAWYRVRGLAGQEIVPPRTVLVAEQEGRKVFFVHFPGSR